MRPHRSELGNRTEPPETSVVGGNRRKVVCILPDFLCVSLTLVAATS